MLSLLASVFVAPVAAPNLIVNGDFSQGRKGYITHYAYSEDIWNHGTYVIGTDPKKHHSGAFSMGDHTNGKGNMFIVNAGGGATDTVWQANINVQAGKTYTFIGWSASWSMNLEEGIPTDITPGRLQMYIDNKPLGPVWKVEARSGIWNKFTVDWTCTTQKAVAVKIVNTNTSEIGNDFAIDDLSFALKEKKD